MQDRRTYTAGQFRLNIDGQTEIRHSTEVNYNLLWGKKDE